MNISTSIKVAKDWVSDESTLIVDTESSGFPNQKNSQVIEIAILSISGKTLFESLVKPLMPVPQDAIDVHYITNEMLENAPSWDEIHDVVMVVLGKAEKYILAYNSDFDRDMIEKTAKMHEKELPRSIINNFDCVMKRYTAFKSFGLEKQLKWDKQALAARELGLETPNELHRASADADLCRRIAIELSKQKKFKAKHSPSNKLTYWQMFGASSLLGAMLQVILNDGQVSIALIPAGIGMGLPMLLTGYLFTWFRSAKEGWISILVFFLLMVFGSLQT